MLTRSINVRMMPEIICACVQVGAAFRRGVRDHERSGTTPCSNISRLKIYSEMGKVFVRFDTVVMLSSRARKRGIHDNVGGFDT
jgi:hypothetical protein